ncbi:MAG: hypothetical protein AAGC85_27755 [Bacteroidota bacterium]
MNIRESLIKDIQEADNQLLKPLFEIWQLLKKNVNSSSSNGNQSFEAFFGILDEKDATEMEEIIQKEFQNIEGDW